MDPRDNVISNILSSLQNKLDQDQLYNLKETLYISLNDYEIQPRTTEIALIDDGSIDSMLKKFFATKKLEGRAASTLKRYAGCLYPMLHEIGKRPDEIETFDLRVYLAEFQRTHNVSNRTLDGMRRCVRSFFGFCHAEQLIDRDPSLALAQIKYDKKMKNAFSAWDMEQIKRACPTLRDRALVEFLYSTGCRVSEVVHLDRSDINFDNKSAIVFGKGSKERMVFLSDVAIGYLREYLISRIDNGPWLFAGLKSPYNRLSKNGIEARLRHIGKLAGVEDVHPHRYRRTLATDMIRRGADIQDVATILGHTRLDTTQVYCNVSIVNVQFSHHQHVN